MARKSNDKRGIWDGKATLGKDGMLTTSPLPGEAPAGKIENYNPDGKLFTSKLDNSWAYAPNSYAARAGQPDRNGNIYTKEVAEKIDREMIDFFKNGGHPVTFAIESADSELTAEKLKDIVKQHGNPPAGSTMVNRSSGKHYFVDGDKAFEMGLGDPIPMHYVEPYEPSWVAKAADVRGPITTVGEVDNDWKVREAYGYGLTAPKNNFGLIGVSDHGSTIADNTIANNAVLHYTTLQSQIADVGTAIKDLDIVDEKGIVIAKACGVELVNGKYVIKTSVKRAQPMLIMGAKKETPEAPVENIENKETEPLWKRLKGMKFRKQ